MGVGIRMGVCLSARRPVGPRPENWPGLGRSRRLWLSPPSGALTPKRRGRESRRAFRVLSPWARVATPAIDPRAGRSRASQPTHEYGALWEPGPKKALPWPWEGAKLKIESFMVAPTMDRRRWPSLGMPSRAIVPAFARGGGGTNMNGVGHNRRRSCLAPPKHMAFFPRAKSRENWRKRLDE
jgi:hypothetical protein